MRYRRELLIGALGYLIGAAILRWTPPFPIPTRFDSTAAAIALGSMILFGALAYVVVARRPMGEKLAAAACIALPVLLGDALETTAYAHVYPKFDPASAAVFASILLFTNLGIIAAGWLADRGVLNVRAA